MSMVKLTVPSGAGKVSCLYVRPEDIRRIIFEDDKVTVSVRAYADGTYLDCEVTDTVQYILDQIKEK